MSDNDNTISKYDRIRGGLHGVALFTKPSTIRNVQTITGRAETFVVETARHDELGDYIFVECVDETGVVRLCLPPKVANAIACQHESLTSRRRSMAGKRRAKERQDRGELPGFMRGRARPKETCFPVGSGRLMAIIAIRGDHTHGQRECRRA